MNSLKIYCINQLRTQVLPVLESLNNEEYTQPLNILSGSSIGQHFRHIIEFFQCLINSKNQVVNYDLRSRNPHIENDIKYSIQVVLDICESLNELPYILTLETEIEGCSFQIKTSLDRELVYMLEHVVHHLAIIKSVLQMNFKHVELPKNFGLAHSTIKYQSA